MKIEIRLKALLQEMGLDRRGIEGQIARDLRLHRHTVAKIYRSEARNPSLAVLGKICDWLQDHGAAGESLLQALFGHRPAELWGAVCAAGTVRMYLGEYQQTEKGAMAVRWISRRDATVHSEFVQLLSTPSETDGHHPKVFTEYVPFRFAAAEPGGSQKSFQMDVTQSKHIFAEMRSQRGRTASILIGSQRVNNLVECMVADLFGCEPFEPIREHARVPFYLAYRKQDRTVPSCFGGSRNPPGRRGAVGPGTYYVRADGKWIYCPWKPTSQDAGIVIVVYDPGAHAMEIALFGFSGRGTEALGREFRRNADSFWPPYVERRGKLIGIYVCQFETTPGSPGDAADVTHAERRSITPIDTGVLDRHLR